MYDCFERVIEERAWTQETEVIAYTKGDQLLNPHYMNNLFSYTQ